MLGRNLSRPYHRTTPVFDPTTRSAYRREAVGGRLTTGRRLTTEREAGFDVSRWYLKRRCRLFTVPIREQERQMRRFKSPKQTQRYLSVHSQVHNLFRVGRNVFLDVVRLDRRYCDSTAREISNTHSPVLD